MRIEITKNSESVVTARQTAITGEQAIVSQLFDTIQQAEKTGLQAWAWAYGRRREVLKRNRNSVVPRLISVARGEHGENDLSRVFAATVLCKIDRKFGVNALWNLLNRENPKTIAAVLMELASEGGVYDSFYDEETKVATIANAQIEKLVPLVNHVDLDVRKAAVWMIGFVRVEAGYSPLRETLATTPELLHAKICEALARFRKGLDVLEIIGKFIVGGRTCGQEDCYFSALSEFARSEDLAVAARAKDILGEIQANLNLSEGVRKKAENCLRTLKGGETYRKPPTSEDIQKAFQQIKLLAEVGIVSQEEAQLVRRRIEESLSKGETLFPTTAIVAALSAAKISHQFDTEHPDVPPPHDELVRELAEISRSVFQPGAVYQYEGPYEEEGDESQHHYPEVKYPVQFIQEEKLYRFWVDHHGDWYQTNSVIQVVNLVLKQVGKTQRFVSIDTGSQDAWLVFCDPQKLSEVAVELGLKIKPLPDKREFCEVPFLAEIHGAMAENFRQANWECIREWLGDASKGLANDQLIRARNQYGCTALHCAASGSGLWRGAVKLLLSHGAEIEARDADGQTPLYAAASDDKEDFISFLIEKGADIAARDNRGWTPLHAAANWGSKKAVSVLLENGAGVDVRTWAPLEKGEESQTIERDSAWEALQWAGLFTGGPKEKGQTPLHRAALRGHLEVVKLLVKRGATVNVTDAKGQTPLHLAVSEECTEVIEYLHSHGANLTVKDLEGRTPDQRHGDHAKADIKQTRRLKLLVVFIWALTVITFPFLLFKKLLNWVGKKRRRN